MGRIQKVFVFLLVLKYSNSIYNPNHITKPPYTPGIKTADWRKPSSDNLQIHHNYTKVFWQNSVGDNGYHPSHQKYESAPTNLHPVYNGQTNAKPAVNPLTIEEENYEDIRHINNHKVLVRRKNRMVEVYNKCPKDFTGQLVFAVSCNQFLNCWKGKTTIQNCAPGTLFNPKSLECDFPAKVQCVTGPRQNSFRSSRQVQTLRQQNCPTEFSGLIPSYADCSLFIICSNGSPQTQKCPPGTLFDIEKNICDHAIDAKCFNGQNEGNHYIENEGNGLLESTDLGSVYNVVEEDNIYSSSSQQYEQENINDKLDFQTPGEHPNTKCNNCNNQKPNRGNLGPNTQNNVDQYSNQQNYDIGSPYNQNQLGQNGQVTNCNDETCVYKPFSKTPPQNYPGNSNLNQENPSTQQTVHGQRKPQNVDQEQSNFDYTSPNHQNVKPNPSNYDTGAQNWANTHIGQNLDQQEQNIDYSQQPSQNLDETHVYDGNSQGFNRQQPSNNPGLHDHPNSQNSNPHRGHNYIQLNNENSDYNNDRRRYNNGNDKPTVRLSDENEDLATHETKNIGNLFEDFNQQQTNRQNGYDSKPNYQGRPPSKNQGGSLHEENNQQNPNCYGNTCQNSGGFSKTHPNNHQHPGGAKIQTVSCGPYESGLQPHPYDCSKFLNCANGQTFIQSCGPGTLFNPSFKNCDFPYNVQCSSHHDDLIGSETSHGENVWDRNDLGDTATTTEQNWNKHRDESSWSSTKGPRISTDGFDTTKATTSKPISSWTVNIIDGDGNLITEAPVEESSTKGRPTQSQYKATTPRTSKWPPPFITSSQNQVVDPDYEYIDLGTEPTVSKNFSNLDCKKITSFNCNPNECIPTYYVCDGKKDCANGKDEFGCEKYLEDFVVQRNARLAVPEKGRFDNTTHTTCAFLCKESQDFKCRSFNYRKVDRACLLTDSNVALSGKLMAYPPNDYYELKTTQINCTGLFKCDNNKCIYMHRICDGQNDCGDWADEKHCPAEKLGYEIKLAGGQNNNEGRIEVTAFGQRGFVCDDQFTKTNADVVCKELGFKLGASEVKKNSFYTKNFVEFKTFYMMDDVHCLGNETSLRDCDFNGWGVSDCLEQEIVGVVCKTESQVCSENYWKCEKSRECIPITFVCDNTPDCTDSSDEGSQYCDAPVDIRLVNGTNEREGRLEIKYHGTWGTVCDDDFNDDAAKVVCKNLGFKEVATVKKDAYFGPGKGPIWLDQVSCFGNESSIQKCPHWDWGQSNCDHNEDVGVICFNSSDSVFEKHNLPSQKIIADNSSYQVYPDTCGLRNDNIFTKNSDVHFRVVKGSRAKPGEYPWQASLRVMGKSTLAHWCGAVIVSEHFVLTAAHCLKGYSKGSYVIIAGDYDTDEKEGTEQKAFIEDFYIHEDFRKGHQMNNDIALIKLKGKGFTLNGNVAAICLPDVDTDYEKARNCTISGFGTIQTGSSGYSHSLNYGWVPLQPKNVCKMPHVYGDAVTDGMVCAGTLDGGTDSCDGDSGGPLACLDQGLFTLYGITSWGHKCGYANKPGVYVKVGLYRKWIDDKVRLYS